MSGKRVLQIGIGIGIVAAALVIVQPLAMASRVSQASGGAMQQANHVYQLGEQYGNRYGETPGFAVAAEALRQYDLSERFANNGGFVDPAEARRLHQLDERYGETP